LVPDRSVEKARALQFQASRAEELMIILLLMAIFGTTLILGAVPVVLLGLMLETCENRTNYAGQVTADPPAPLSKRFTVETVRAAA
jgi:hypothetical protein